MKEEDKLFRKIGTDNHFTVPENYFERLTSEVMEKLPERAPVMPTKKTTKWDRIKPWTYMAAMFMGAALIIKVASYNPNPFSEPERVSAEANNIEAVSDEYLDYAVTQSMLDDYSLYVYLTDNEIE